MTNICASNLAIVGQKLACRLAGVKQLSDQCWNIVSWTQENKIQLHIIRDLYNFIQENTFENVVWKIGGHFVSASMC